jgi:hypothetical protein
MVICVLHVTLVGSWSDGRRNGSEIVGYMIPLLVMHDAPGTVAQSLLPFCHFYSTTIFSSSSKNKERQHTNSDSCKFYVHIQLTEKAVLKQN